MSASGVDIVVRGGKVVTSTDVVEAAVAIRGDKIVAIGPDSVLPKADREIDASGKLVLPGLIDCHLHVGPEYDDWRTAPLAARPCPRRRPGCARRPNRSRSSTSAFISS
jgi:imidazolonepropionase-like amidohydrolase